MLPSLGISPAKMCIKKAPEGHTLLTIFSLWETKIGFVNFYTNYHLLLKIIHYKDASCNTKEKRIIFKITIQAVIILMVSPLMPVRT